jgi:hypothetical protein
MIPITILEASRRPRKNRHPKVSPKPTFGEENNRALRKIDFFPWIVFIFFYDDAANALRTRYGAISCSDSTTTASTPFCTADKSPPDKASN